MFFALRFVWKFSAKRNRTVLGIVIRQQSDVLNILILVLFTSIIGQLVVFLGVAVFTTTLVLKLKQQSKWRLASSAQERLAEISTRRDARVVKLVTIISSFYVILNFPKTIYFFCLIAMPEFLHTEPYTELIPLLGACVNTLEVLNYLVNTLVYWKLSTQYRQQFIDTLSCGFSSCRN